VLEDLDFVLRAGESWAVVGGNGAGKTSFLRLLRGEIWPLEPAARQYHEPDGARVSPIGFRQRSRLVTPETAEAFRRSGWSLPGVSAILTGLGDAAYSHIAPSEAQQAAAMNLLTATGAENLADVAVSAMSEGQTRLVLILRALMARPEVLFVDELLDGLDTHVRERVLNLLEQAASQGCQLVIATHRPDELPARVTNVARLERGRIKALGGRELLAVPETRPDAIQSAPEGDAPILWDMANVSVAMNGRRVLRDVSWRVRRGENWAVTGANGAGKSTLLNLVAGELFPLPGGRVMRFGRRKHSLWRLRQRIGLISFEIQANYHGKVTVLETVVSGLRGSVGLYEPATDTELAQARALLERFNRSDLAERRLDSLSFGQRRMAIILRSLVYDPAALLLDEPFTGLDAASRSEVAATLGQAAAQGTTLIMVSHRSRDLPPEVGLELELEGGRVAYAGIRRG
jgi:molybdate transport system ATP-binding protein